MQPTIYYPYYFVLAMSTGIMEVFKISVRSDEAEDLGADDAGENLKIFYKLFI